MPIDWRTLALASALLLQSCGGGGGGGDGTGSSSSSGGFGTPPSGGSGTPPSGGSGTPPAGNTPPAGTPTPANPRFTSDFVEFVGWPKATVAADIDNDGRLDIVVLTTDHFASGVPEAKGIDIFYQRDTGFAVASAATAAIIEQAQSLAACDIDGDGKKEILVGYNGADLRVHALAQNGTPLPPTTLLGVRSFSVECLDLDGDGNSDLVTTGKVGFDVQVLLQRNGQLGELEVFPTDDPSTAAFPFPRLKAVGDINGDGKPDLVFEGFDRARSRGVFVAYLQIDGGRFIPSNAQKPIPVVLDLPQDIGHGNSFAIVDLFENGMRDIVVASGGNQPGSRITIATFASNGQLVSSPSFLTSDIPVSLRIADMDGDGRNDIVVYHNGHGAVGVHYQNFNGSFREEQRLFLPGPAFADSALTDQAIVIGDFDSNGKLDIALGSQSALFFFFQD